MLQEQKILCDFGWFLPSAKHQTFFVAEMCKVSLIYCHGESQKDVTLIILIYKHTKYYPSKKVDLLAYNTMAPFTHTAFPSSAQAFYM